VESRQSRQHGWPLPIAFKMILPQLSSFSPITTWSAGAKTSMSWTVNASFDLLPFSVARRACSLRLNAGTHFDVIHLEIHPGAAFASA
jgi:hypothetical protein